MSSSNGSPGVFAVAMLDCIAEKTRCCASALTCPIKHILSTSVMISKFSFWCITSFKISSFVIFFNRSSFANSTMSCNIGCSNAGVGVNSRFQSFCLASSFSVTWVPLVSLRNQFRVKPEVLLSFFDDVFYAG